MQWEEIQIHRRCQKQLKVLTCPLPTHSSVERTDPNSFTACEDQRISLCMMRAHRKANRNTSCWVYRNSVQDIFCDSCLSKLRHSLNVSEVIMTQLILRTNSRGITYLITCWFPSWLNTTATLHSVFSHSVNWTLPLQEVGEQRGHAPGGVVGNGSKQATTGQARTCADSRSTVSRVCVRSWRVSQL